MSRAEITFREGRPDDVIPMWKIDQACFDAQTAYTVDIFYFHLLVGRAPAFVAEDASKKIVGFVLCAVEKKKTGTIVTIDIVEGLRGKGIGRELMGLAEKALRGRGVARIELQTAVENEAAIKFYESLGYARGKKLPDYYAAGRDAFQYDKKSE